MNKTLFYSVKTSFLFLVFIFSSSCEKHGGTEGHSAVTNAISNGDKCEIVLRGDALQGLGRMVTPKHTSENIDGSKDSVFGRILKLDKDWIAVSLADIRVEIGEGSMTTFGTAGRLQEYVYYIPMSSIAYIRTWE
jgi:hypothetical protein